MNPLRLQAAIYCGLLAVLIAVSHRREREYLEIMSAAEEPDALLGRWRVPRLSPNQFTLAGAILVAALAFAAAGVATRAALAASLAAYFLYFGQIRGLASVQRKTDLMPQVLAVLLIAPGIASPTAGASPAWSLLVIKAIVLQPYFGAALNKLRVTGLRWADGVALQGALLWHHLHYDLPFALRVASQPRACAALSVATLTFELGSPLALIGTAASAVFAVTAVSFHLATLGLMRINYLKYHAPALVVFVVEPLALLWPGA